MCRDSQISPSVITHLECHTVSQVAGITKHELGSFVCVVKEDLHLIPQELEELEAQVPPQDAEPQKELEDQPPQYRTPLHLVYVHVHDVVIKVEREICIYMYMYSISSSYYK